MAGRQDDSLDPNVPAQEHFQQLHAELPQGIHRSARVIIIHRQ